MSYTINGKQVTVPGTQGIFISSGDSQVDKKEKLWVFNNVEKSPDTLITRVEFIATSKGFEAEFFYDITAADTMKSCFKTVLKSPEFIQDEMTRMRLSNVEDIRQMALLMVATQKFSPVLEADSTNRMAEVMIALPRPERV